MAGVRNVVGGRSKSLQGVLERAKIEVIQELKVKAVEVDADAVVAVQLCYQDIGATGSSMLMVVAYGTAVKL